jgi:hypothetical protein
VASKLAVIRFIHLSIFVIYRLGCHSVASPCYSIVTIAAGSVETLAGQNSLRMLLTTLMLNPRPITAVPLAPFPTRKKGSFKRSCPSPSNLFPFYIRTSV